jgi:hypothetical protein
VDQNPEARKAFLLLSGVANPMSYANAIAIEL